MTRHRSVRQISGSGRRRSSFRFLATTLLATSMVATGGFGALPENPITQAVQEEIGKNFSEPFLEPVNSLLDQLSAPTIEPQPDSSPNPPLDLIGLIFGDTKSPEAPVPATPTFDTPAVTGEAPGTGTPTITPTPTLTLTATATVTPTPTVTLTGTTGPVCSNPTTTPATTTFFNGSGLTVEVYLVDPTCKLTLITTLGPEGSIVQETFIGELWWFVDASSTRFIADHVVSSATELVDVSTGTTVVATATSATPATSTPFYGFTVSNVSLTDDLSQFGTSITLSPGQEFYVTYDFQVFSDPCPGCITQLVTGLGNPGTHGGTCAYNGVPGVSPGVAGFESVTLYAPEASGTYPVVVEYHWQFTCFDALTFYGTGGAAPPQVIGQVIVP